MRDDEAIKRLEKYLGGALKIGDQVAPRRRRLPPAAWQATNAKRMKLEEVAPAGYAVRVPDRGAAFKVLTPISESQGYVPCSSFTSALLDENSSLQARLRARTGINANPGEILFFDIETVGLVNSPLFLIGALSVVEDSPPLIRQFLARDATEEAAVIQLFLDLASDKELFITFNGKSFDLPIIYQRAEYHGLPCVLHAHHFDLLHECRRVWQSTLPNCQLQTLEQHLLNHPPRSDDIHGEQIPDAYQAFLRNGNAHPLSYILRHNLQDLLSMAEICSLLPPMGEDA